VNPHFAGLLFTSALKVCANTLPEFMPKNIIITKRKEMIFEKNNDFWNILYKSK